MLINPNDEIKRLKKTEDKISDKITGFAGSMQFVYIHSVWFTVWILINVGVFGAALIFDGFPFGFLTLIVSLEAIFLSTFVMISQNRQAKVSDIRSELDYRVNVKAEKEVKILLSTLHRLADKQGIDVSDLLEEYEAMHTPPNKNNSSKPGISK